MITVEAHIATSADIPPHGMCCACDCGCKTCFQEGDVYLSVLLGMVEDVPMTEIRCVLCKDCDASVPETGKDEA